MFRGNDRDKLEEGNERGREKKSEDQGKDDGFSGKDIMGILREQ